MRLPALLLTGVLVLACSPGAGASDHIVIGQSADLSGQHAHLTRQFLAGAHAYFAQVNGKGGIHGRQIRLATMDDQNDPILAIQNTRQLLQEDKALALFGYVGWQTSSAVLPIVNENGVPFFAPVTGARIVYNALNRHVFTIRASYVDEYSYMFAHFSRIGLKRLAIFTDHPNVPSHALLQTMIDTAGAELVTTVSAVGPSMEKMAGSLLRARPDIILVMSISPALNLPLIELLRAKGYRGYFYAASLVYSTLDDSRHKALAGMIVSQAMPFPWKSTLPIVRQYQQAMRQARASEFSHLGLEGFIAARVLAEGIRRAGPAPTRNKLIAALESINEKNYDGLGYRINFSGSNRHGASHVDLTTITSAGTLAH
ncbi:ABC transporter substrate-binding protein [Herbaspirillum sp. SJZ099]|uniref:ABC transporter substrate-binding protein n=1 Tax=Herbaspirillum sp. SJZ099 TaxID=2572916 RepID=UPI0011A01233|nr:ABC transporter substrate-binding protein [Herbaspirillum sp. SJZ099]TWC69832.1 amino acid/amide ABC transporter substrate-binding protein (HAAT family) [Herbaspirillum sp. SJZ099]